MRRRIVQALLTTMLVSSMTVTPVFATTLEDMQEDKSKAESEASSLQEQLTETLDKIDTLESDLEAKQEEVDKADQDLEKAAAKQTEQYEAMKLRIKYMYEEGDASFLEVILTSTSISDFINKAEYVSDVHSYDRTKLNEYKETTEKVESLKDSLEEEYTQMQTMQTQLEEEKSSLSVTLEEKKDEIAQLDESIQAEIAARQEAERKAQEEAAQAEAAAQAAAQQAAAQQTQTNTTSNSGSSTNSGSSNSGSGSSSSGSSSSGGSSSGTSSSGSATVKPQGTNGWAVVAYARQFIGNPYVYGGNSLTNGIDCSGFTQQIYAAFGVSLPRTDSAQALCGVEVPLSQAQAGDLICYNGHVGIYNGSGGIIHASSPSVGIVEFSNCQYRTIKCIRRVL